MHFNSIVAIAALTFSLVSAQSVSTDGRCGNGVTCAGSKFGNCCSRYGWCGSNAHFCNAGCQSASGSCGVVGSGQKKGSQAKIADAASSSTLATVTRAASTPAGYQAPAAYQLYTPAPVASVSVKASA